MQEPFVPAGQLFCSDSRHQLPHAYLRSLQLCCHREAVAVLFARHPLTTCLPQHLSTTTAIPCPTPLHMSNSAWRPPVACRRFTAVVTSRAPLAPSGWPSAMAPPQAFTRSSSSC